MPEITRNEVRIFYSQWGEGTPVLFHTGGAGDGRMWQMAGYTEALVGCRQLLLDHRGRGRSSRPPNVEDHRLDEYVVDVIAVLDHVGTQSAVLIGYSFGARVAYAVAARHPSRCRALVGIGGLASRQDVSSEIHARATEIRRRGTRAIIEEMAAEEDEECPMWLIDNLSSTESEMFAIHLEAGENEASEWDDFPSVTAPSLIVCGENEDGGEAAEAATMLPEGKTAVLPGYGHLQTFWHGEVTAPLIRDFLEFHELLAPRDASPG